MSCATNGTGEMALNTTRLQVSLAGLNSFYALKVLSPVAYTTLNSVRPYELENLISLGYCPYVGSSSCNPFELLMSYTPPVEVSFHCILCALCAVFVVFCFCTCVLAACEIFIARNPVLGRTSRCIVLHIIPVFTHPYPCFRATYCF